MPRPFVRSRDQVDRYSTRRLQYPALELRILVVSDLAGAYRMHARDHHDRLVWRELHDFPGRQQRTRCLLAADHEMAKPW